MALDVKICGLKTVDAIDCAITGGATHCGFIFFTKSPRHIDTKTAADLRKKIGSRATTVAVTVDADDAYLDDIASMVKPDLMQLHGSESPHRVAQIKAHYGIPAMKVFPVRKAGDLAGIDAYRSVADRLMFDAKAPKGSDLPGGNGVSFDWSLLDRLDPDIDYMLSGGINADNVAEAICAAKPGGIDVSSGVEAAPGVKDATLISAFFDALNLARHNAG